MKVRTIPTPGGQLVDVIPDKVYAARSGASEQALRQWAAKRPILGALWIGGPVEDDSGKATSKLHATAVELGYAGSPSAITGLINGMSHAVKSDRRGRRTYRIELETLPERWATKLLEDSELNPPASSSPDGDGEVATEPLETIEEPEATESAEELLEAPSAILESLQVEEGGGPAPSWDLEVTSAVAMSLLTRVVEIISTGSSDETSARLRSERDDARNRLHEHTAYTERLRKDLRTNGDELAAVKSERDGLRKRLRLAEENLRKATSPDVQRTVDGLVREQLDRVMRAAPTARGA